MEDPGTRSATVPGPAVTGWCVERRATRACCRARRRCIPGTSRAPSARRATRPAARAPSGHLRPRRRAAHSPGGTNAASTTMPSGSSTRSSPSNSTARWTRAQRPAEIDGDGAHLVERALPRGDDEAGLLLDLAGQPGEQRDVVRRRSRRPACSSRTSRRAAGCGRAARRRGSTSAPGDEPLPHVAEVTGERRTYRAAPVRVRAPARSAMSGRGATGERRTSDPAARSPPYDHAVEPDDPGSRDAPPQMPSRIAFLLAFERGGRRPVRRHHRLRPRRRRLHRRLRGREAARHAPRIDGAPRASGSSRSSSSARCRSGSAKGSRGPRTVRPTGSGPEGEPAEPSA